MYRALYNILIVMAGEGRRLIWMTINNRLVCILGRRTFLQDELEVRITRKIR